MELKWVKTGKWSCNYGPSWTAEFVGGHVTIWSSRWRCGERGRRGYLNSYRIVVYLNGESGKPIEMARDIHSLAKAKEVAEVAVRNAVEVSGSVS